MPAYYCAWDYRITQKHMPSITDYIKHYITTMLCTSCSCTGARLWLAFCCRIPARGQVRGTDGHADVATHTDENYSALNM